MQKNIAMFVPEVEIKTVADPFMNDETEKYLKTTCRVQNVTKDAEDILNDREIEAVLICSSTDTHSKYIIEAAKAGKHIFCEKPVDYDLAKVHEAIDTAKEAGVKLQIGFCRRFDHNHRGVYDMVPGRKSRRCTDDQDQLQRSGAAVDRLCESIRRNLLRYDDP